MTKSEKEKLVAEVHKETLRRIGGHLHDVVNSAVDKRIPTDEHHMRPGGIYFVDPDTQFPIPRSNYNRSRERSLWNPHEEQVLRDELSAAIRMIAIAHRRTFGGIRSRLKKMGIISDYSLLMED